MDNISIYGVHLLVFAGPSPAKNRIPFEITGNYMNGWTVEWFPCELGVYLIEVTYGQTHVVGSPFKCKVYDISKVFIIRDLNLDKKASIGLSPEEVVFYGQRPSLLLDFAFFFRTRLPSLFM